MKSARALLLGAALLVAASMAAALYLQHVVGLAPCPLCVLQRMGIIAAGLFALLAAWAARGSIARLVAGGAAVVSALAGGGVAVWHSWLLAHPPEQLGCGRPFEWFHEDFPLVVWLPRLFRGDGDCLAVEWSLFGLTVPHWSLLAFAGVLVLLARAMAVTWRDRAR
jgi:disulfide bond formation protein DsbB